MFSRPGADGDGVQVQPVARVGRCDDVPDGDLRDAHHMKLCSLKVNIYKSE
jgi:hypothetical protein